MREVLRLARCFWAQCEDNGMTAQIFKYDAKGSDAVIRLKELDLAKIGANQLIWIDVEGSEAKLLPQIAERLKLESTHFSDTVTDFDNAPQNFATHLRFAAVTAPAESKGKHISRAASQKVLGKKVTFFIGEKWLMTFHDQPAEFLQNFREQDRADSKVGLLTPSSLAASLLDWMLTEYYSSVANIAAEVDELDEIVLRDAGSNLLLEKIVALRRRTSLLRTSLVSNRAALYGLVRPDLTLIAHSESSALYATLVSRFERALDEIERARDLITGSFELFGTRNGIQTNNLVKLLTVITAVLGYFGAVAGIFGMNIKASVFNGGDGTFAVVLGVLVISSAAAIWFARRLKWL
jgi:magnesium transporter